MQENKSKLYFKLLGVALVLLLVVLSVMHVYHSLVFGIVSTDPTAGKMTIWSTSLNITFNKALSANGLLVSVQPDGVIYNNQVKVSDKTLTIALNTPLNPNSTYTFIIHYIADSAGQKITNKQLVFSPKNVSRSQIQEDDQETLIQRNQSSTAYSDPILSHLPYSNLDFSLTSSFSVSSNNLPELVLQAQLLIPPGITGDQETSTANQYKQEISSYISSLGLNPASYTIQYQTVNETLNGP